jgi:hypothetical protein
MCPHLGILTKFYSNAVFPKFSSTKETLNNFFISVETFTSKNARRPTDQNKTKRHYFASALLKMPDKNDHDFRGILGIFRDI